MEVEPLNMRTYRGAVKNVTQYVQDEKIQISRRTITKLQYREQWPDKYNSFVTSKTRKNRYTDPERFFRVMHHKPQLYLKKFFFEADVDYSERIKKATIDAWTMVIQKAQQYSTQPGSVSTGLYSSSFKIYFNGALLTNVGDLDGATAASTVRIYNTTPYAATAEKNALYFAKIGGILFYAAKQIKDKYPELGVRFVYVRSDQVQGTYSRYDVPMLEIGTKQSVPISRIRRPGKRHRSRVRRNRRSS